MGGVRSNRVWWRAFRRWGVAFFVSALFVVILPLGPSLAHPAWHRSAGQVNRIKTQIEFAKWAADTNDVVLSDEVVRKWLAGHMSQESDLAYELYDSPKTDPWGNPYQLKSLHGENVQVYSLGEDGVTRSEGNDEDDIRSWDSNPTAWYLRRARIRSLAVALVFSVICTPVSYAVLAIIREVWRTMMQGRT